MNRFLTLLLLSFINISLNIFASEESNNSASHQPQKDAPNKEETPPHIGNFKLPASQEPGPLVSFGENIIDKGELQIFLSTFKLSGKKKLHYDVLPSLLYGVTDDFSVYFVIPFEPYSIDGCNKSSGLEDCVIQLEYAFYKKVTKTYFQLATVVGNVTFPTGSDNKNPVTGFGSPSYFIGATYNCTYVNWYWFTSYGALLTTASKRTKFGNQYLYQFGFGRNIPSPDGWIYAWLFELNGFYNEKNKISGKKDPDSGGNTIFATPSILISSKEVSAQLGVGFPINQSIYGKQNKIDYAVFFSFSWSIYNLTH